MREDLYVLELDEMQQSAVDLEDPTHLFFDYTRRIGDIIDRLPDGPLRVVHVGGAAMTLPRYVHATRPRSSQIVLEPSTELVERVRAEAPLPPRSGIKVRPVDGLNGMRSVRDGFADLVILDAFDRARTPTELTSAAFVEDVRRALSPGGVFVANLVDRAPFTRVRDFVAAARDLGSMAIGVEPATAKGRRSGNLVIACGTLPPAPFGTPPPMEYRTFSGRAVADSFGGGRP
ncbi:spermidine synthase [Nocardioides albertanoniae]|nr:fused MFS/spermidine synthase [Nocardioides albertanoniae]